MGKQKAEDERPYTVWRFNPNCTAAVCSCCGYFWGPGASAERDGKRVVWNVSRRNEPPIDWAAVYAPYMTPSSPSPETAR